MNVLIACEESQRVCTEFRKRGHQAFSADIQECSGGHPEWHILGDVLPILNGNCQFKTQSGEWHCILGKWDLIIAHPPCTYLTNCGERWFDISKYGDKAIKRHQDRKDAIVFFMAFVNADCDKIAIENPVGHMSSVYRKPNQIIQPWQFGDDVVKTTCLWLKGLPNLMPWVSIKPEIEYKEWTYKGKHRRESKFFYDSWSLPPTERAKVRSKTFPGIAKAMAEQWG